VRRPNAKLHAAFAHGPHVCIGMHLARLEAHTAVGGVLERLPGLRLEGAAPAGRGLVFRKPDALRVRWTPLT
jgi:cytochrome P450